MSRAEQADAGVVDEDGDETERSFRLRNQVGNVRKFCDIGDLGMDGATNLCESLGGLLEGRTITAANRYGGSQNGKLARDRAADATATAGDQRDSASQRLLFQGLLEFSTAVKSPAAAGKTKEKLPAA